MARKKNEKSLFEQCEKITVRFGKPQARKIAEQCLLWGVKPAQYLRISGINFSDHEYLDLKTAMQRVEEEQRKLRLDFLNAVAEGDE